MCFSPQLKFYTLLMSYEKWSKLDTKKQREIIKTKVEIKQIKIIDMINKIKH